MTLLSLNKIFKIKIQGFFFKYIPIDYNIVISSLKVKITFFNVQVGGKKPHTKCLGYDDEQLILDIARYWSSFRFCLSCHFFCSSGL